MKLRYRGIDYDYNPPMVTVAEAKVAGKYRGLDWRHHDLKTTLTLQPKFNLTYRGVRYYSQPISELKLVGS